VNLRAHRLDGHTMFSWRQGPPGHLGAFVAPSGALKRHHGAMTDPQSNGQKSQVTVRTATTADLADLLHLYQLLAGTRVNALPAEPDEAMSLLKEIRTLPSRQLLVAEVDGKVVGTVDLLIVANLTHHGAPWAIVENVVVDEIVRRRGVGSALIDEVVRRCSDADCYKVQLLSNKQRTQAHGFYRSVGFEAVAEGFRRFLV
jgi:GNAT superfamily N-acetyltransferase